MRLASLRAGGRDGTLVVVRRDGQAYARATAVAATLQVALDDWDRSAPALGAIAADLDSGKHAGEPLRIADLAAPLPRVYSWVDASAFLHHVRLARAARGAEPPTDLLTDPLLYQGGSGFAGAATDPIVRRAASDDLDFEAEVGVILGDVPAGLPKAHADRCVRLLCLVNDVTLRGLVPAELAKGFGFFHAKPGPTFSPFAVTPDEFGPSFRDGRLHLDVRVHLNETLIGTCDAGAMHFSFFELIAHAARNRRFAAGSVLGSGTVSNEDPVRGVGCLVERRMAETLESGSPRTPYLAPGDVVRIEAFDDQGRSPFGAIEQRVVAE